MSVTLHDVLCNMLSSFNIAESYQKSSFECHLSLTEPSLSPNKGIVKSKSTTSLETPAHAFDLSHQIYFEFGVYNIFCVCVCVCIMRNFTDFY